MDLAATMHMIQSSIELLSILLIYLLCIPVILVTAAGIAALVSVIFAPLWFPPYVAYKVIRKLLK